MTESWGPVWIPPIPVPCPDCKCCSKRLCEAAKAKPAPDQNCAHHGNPTLWDQLIGCPCPRVDWSPEQRDGTACVFCGRPVDPADRDRTRRLGMNGGLVSACVPCMDAYRASLNTNGAVS